LQHIPVLDDLSVRIEPKDVDAGPVTLTRPPLKAVHDNELSLCESPLEFDTLSWILACHPFEVLDECFLAISD